MVWILLYHIKHNSLIQIVALVIFSKDVRTSRCFRVRITLRGTVANEHIKNHELTHGWHELLVKGRYRMLFVRVAFSPGGEAFLSGEYVEHLTPFLQRVWVTQIRVARHKRLHACITMSTHFVFTVNKYPGSREQFVLLPLNSFN